MTKLSVDFLDDALPVIVLTWKKEQVQEVETAKMRFDDYMRRGWIAFAERSNNTHIQIFHFDASFEKIILAPIVEGG